MDVQTVARRLRVALPLLLLLGGCATNRTYISLAVPQAGTRVTGDKVVVIDTVADQREFQADPDDPSTPSLKKGTDYALDANGRKSAIARKRNGYGHAIGDIQLQPPQTVETIARQLVTQGLEERGYRVIDASAAATDALRVKVGIKEFWAWFTPGFWAVDMEAKVKTALEFTGPVQRNVEVAAYGKNTAQSGRAGNWKEAYDRAFKDYLEKQRAAFAQAGL